MHSSLTEKVSVWIALTAENYLVITHLAVACEEYSRLLVLLFVKLGKGVVESHTRGAPSSD